jgi:hypothetical protein
VFKLDWAPEWDSTMNKYEEILLEASYNADTNFNVEVRDYSGRYMFGKECLAITGTMVDCIAVLVKAAQSDPDSFEDGRLLKFRQDSMGFDGVVLYWPHIEITVVNTMEE